MDTLGQGPKVGRWEALWALSICSALHPRGLGFREPLKQRPKTSWSLGLGFTRVGV